MYSNCHGSQIRIAASGLALAILASLGLGTAASSQQIQLTRAQSAVALHQQDLSFDRETARASRLRWSNYQDAVNNYIQEVELSLSEAHQCRARVEGQLAQLEQQIKHLSGPDRAQAVEQAANLKSWLTAEAKLSNQAAYNIALCNRYIASYKAQSNIDSYNAAQDEQAIADDQRRINEAQQAIAAQQRKAQDAAYWQARNGADYSDYGYGGYYPRGRYGRGYGYGYRHGGGGGGSAAAVAHSTVRMSVGGHR